MATAESTKQIVITGVTLNLTREEARVLLYLCNNVGGETKTSARRFIDSIGQALMSADVYVPSSESEKLHNGSFYFVSNSDGAFKGL